MNNLEVARILENIADILELQNVKWKPEAYRNAARSIELLSENIKKVYKRGELEKIPGVGEHISVKIKELLETGKLKYYNKLKKKVKIDIEKLKAIPGLGSKKIKVLFKKLGIKTVKDLEKAIKDKKIRKLRGFGKKSEQSFLDGIKILKRRKRFMYSEVELIVKNFLKYFKALPFVSRVEIAGSFRRKEKTIGDLDFLVISKKSSEVMNAFIERNDVQKIVAKGRTKSSIRLDNGLQIDLRVVSAKEFGAALLYFTGNKQHNIELRKIALRKGWTLNEYSLSDVKTKKVIAGKTEKEIYNKLSFKLIPPKERLNKGELKKYKK